MIAEWPVVRLGEYCSKIGSGATPKGGKSVYLESGDITLIRSQNIYNDGFESDGLVYITTQAAEKLNNVEVQPNDVLLNITGDSVARVCLAPNKHLPARVNQHVAIIRPDPEEFDPRFLRYLLTSPNQQALLLTIASAGATRNALTKSHIESLEVLKPDLQTQRCIADQLHALEKKIQLNGSINQTLEQMAQAIFKSWFVDFEPVKAKIAALNAGGSEEDALLAAMQAISGKGEAELARLEAEQPEQYAELRATAELFPSAMQDSELGEIPEGWAIAPFSSIARLDTTSVKPAQDPEKVWEHYSIPAFDEGATPAFETGADIKSNKYKVYPTAVLSSKLNPHFPRTWIPDVQNPDAAICSTEFMQFVPLEPQHRAFIAGMITSEPFQSGIMMRVTGSTGSRQRAQPKQVAAMDVILPKSELRAVYSQHTEAMYRMQSKNIWQAQSLASVRDSLLPKLLSGELSVPSNLGKTASESLTAEQEAT